MYNYVLLQEGRKGRLMDKRSSWIIITVAAILLIACAVALTVHHFLGDSGLSPEQQKGEELRPLVLRREQILREIEQLNSDPRYKELPHGSNATVMYIDLGAALYDSVYKSAYKNLKHASGTLCFSPSQLPGLEGNITVAQCNEMLSAGWSTAIFWDGTGELSEYLSLMDGLLSELGYEMPEAVFFDRGAYNEGHGATLIGLGIHYAVHHGESGDPMVEIRTEGELLLPGAYGWNAPNQQKNFLNAIKDNRGCGVFSVSFGFGNDPDALLRVGNGSDFTAFCRMIAYLDDRAAEGSVGSQGVPAAFETRYEFETAKAEIDRDIQERITALNAELAEIKLEIEEINRKYEDR